MSVMHLSIFSSRVGWGDTGGIRSQNNPNPRELNRTPRHGGGKFDTFCGSSKLDHITNFMIRPGDFGHHILPMGWELDPNFSKLSYSQWVSPPHPPSGEKY